MNRFEHQWQKLTALARSAPVEPEAAAPYGFATRVAAQAAALPTGGVWLALERFVLRGLIAACALSFAAIAFNYSAAFSAEGDDEALIEFINTDYDVS